MATISLTVPDAIAPRVRDAVCLATGYTELVPNPNFDPEQPVGQGNLEFMSNPVSKMAWVKMQLIEYLKATVRRIEMQNFDVQQRQDRLAQEQAIDQALNLS